MPKCVLDSCVEEEVLEIWRFIAKDNPDAALRVVEAAYQTFDILAANPKLGARVRFRNPKLSEVRSWRISEFPNYLIFYRIVHGGIQIHHVYHGARDIEKLLRGH